MKKLVLSLTFFALFAVGVLSPTSAAEQSDYVIQWRAFTMPVSKWQEMSDSEKMKVSRFFADQYYEMDETCTNAKVTVNEKGAFASMVIECVERGTDIRNEKAKSDKNI